MATFKLKALNLCPILSSDFVDISKIEAIPCRFASLCSDEMFFFFCIAEKPDAHFSWNKRSSTNLGPR